MAAVAAGRITLGGRPVLNFEQRQLLKQEYNRIKRLRGSGGFLSDATQAAIMRSFEDGLTPERIASGIWKRSGFLSLDSCLLAVNRLIAQRLAA